MTPTPSSFRPIRVLVVDDSAVVRAFLTALLETEPGIQVAGVAANGYEAIAAVADLEPDVVTMDIRMPLMDGLEAIRRIMRKTPLPIVVVSGNSDLDEVASTFQAMEAGAVAFLARPHGIGHAAHAQEARRFVRMVRAMAEVKVIRRWDLVSRGSGAETIDARPHSDSALRVEIVAIGASTGGPLALATILSSLPQALPVPLVIVQHMSEGFLAGFADWLSRSTGFPVQLAVHGERMLPGRAYLAPEGRHLTVGPDLTTYLRDDPPEGGHRPSVSHLFRSVAQSYRARVLAVLLTGMGSDGAMELAFLRELGALTVIQDRETCAVYGMPGAAEKLGAAKWLLNPVGIAELITEHAVLKP